MKSQGLFCFIKTNFSLLSAGVFIFIILFTASIIKSGSEKKLKGKLVILNETKAPTHDLSYIKPFTALMRFGHKATKGSEIKIGPRNAFQIPFPFINLKRF